ncbi:hypothetical protein AAEX63_11875 [Luteococcus sp. H138]|uniref:CdiA C-terminal domain-containing protein n=1 Tax=unclassified Luteococcus TaxID=2639923 RepID=UPI00313EE2FA
MVPAGVTVAPHEMTTARALAAHGANVVLLSLLHGEGIKNPDAAMDGEVWEFKAPQGASERSTIDSQFRRARAQSRRIVIDLARCGLSEQLAVRQCAYRFYGQRRINRLLVLDKMGTMAFYGCLT